MAEIKTDLAEKRYILSQVKDQGPRSPADSVDSVGQSDIRELISNDSSASIHSSLPFASFNYINSIIGSGVIGISFALQEAGFWFGLFLLVLVALITDYSLILMVRGGHLAGIFSYQGLMEASFGKPGFILLSLLQFMYPFIAMVSYNIVVGDTLTKVFVRVFHLNSTSLLAKREIVVGLATFLVTLPLCLYKDVSKLAKVSLMSLVCVGFILIAIFLKIFMLYDVVPKSDNAWQVMNWDIVPAIGIMAFAFMCHHNTFLIYGSIANADQHRWDKVTHISLFVSFIIAALFGIIGYITFTGYSQGDLLENYCPNDDLMNAARIFFSITILLTFPIECFVTREVIENTIYQYLNFPYRFTALRHNITTVLIVVLTFLISMTTDCLGVVLELNGVMAAVPLAYILPALCYIKLEPSHLFSRQKLPSLALVLFGCTVALLGVISMSMNYSTIGNCSHGKVMDYCLKNSTMKF